MYDGPKLYKWLVDTYGETHPGVQRKWLGIEDAGVQHTIYEWRTGRNATQATVDRLVKLLDLDPEFVRCFRLSYQGKRKLRQKRRGITKMVCEDCGREPEIGEMYLFGTHDTTRRKSYGVLCRTCIPPEDFAKYYEKYVQAGA